MLKIQYVDKEIPLSTRDSGNQNFIKLRNSGEDKSSDALQAPSYSDYEVAEPDND